MLIITHFLIPSGEVPKFFDNVLSKRASEAVTVKGHWWDARREAAQEGIKEKQFQVGEATDSSQRVYA